MFIKKALFTRWELYHSTASVDQHFLVLEELKERGIDYKTKGLNFGGGYGGGAGFSTVYHVYVRKNEV